jgi:hypothetical protein
VSLVTTVRGKVVDGSALVAWAKGNLAMATWREMAWADNLTFVVPIDARNEAVRAHPGDITLIDYFLSAPNVLTQAAPEDADLRAVDEGHDEGVFDPLATWVAGLCRRRGWSVLARDVDRVRRVGPDVEVDAL